MRAGKKNKKKICQKSTRNDGKKQKQERYKKEKKARD